MPARLPQPGPKACASRPLSGLTEARFQEQDARLSLIESGLKELQQKSDDRHVQAQADRQADSAAHQADINELRGQLGSMSAEFAISSYSNLSKACRDRSRNKCNKS